MTTADTDKTLALQALGWTEALEAAFEPHRQQGWLAGRVCVQHRDLYHLFTAQGEVEGIVTGRLRHSAAHAADFPAVGDWVAFGPSEYAGPVAIQAVLPRRSKFSRMAAGDTPYEQLIATNVDAVFIVSGLDDNYNLRRIERYATQVRHSGAEPVVLLNKADLCTDPDAVLAEVTAALPGVVAHAVSGALGDGVEALAPWLTAGQTVAFVGSSGVGKSTLVNRLLGRQQMETHEVRTGDSRGRHTTTHRELAPTPGGALLIDTPGMREFGLWADGEQDAGDVEDAFEDVAILARQCKFPGCRHMGDKGCRVQQAVQAGTLDYDRVRSFRALTRELAASAERKQPRGGRRDADTKRRAKRSERRSSRRNLLDDSDD